MKKIIYLIAFLFAGAVYSQGGGLIDALKFKGSVTTTIRDTFTVPTNQNWIIYNTTTDQYETAGDNEVWTAFGTYTASSDLSLTANEFGLSTGILDRITANDAKVTNTDNQNLTLTGTALAIENGNTANFTGWDTDASNDIIRGMNTQFNSNFRIANDIGALFFGTNKQIELGDGSLGFSIYGETSADEDDQYLQASVEGVAGASNIIIRPNQVKIGSGSEVLIEKRDSQGIATKQYMFDGTYNSNSDVATKVDVDAAVSAGAGTDDQTAAEVTIADAGSIITGTNVETALQENRAAINLNTAKTDNSLSEANQTTPSNEIRQITPGTGGTFRLRDASGRIRMSIVSNSIAQAEGTFGISENATFFENSGTDDDIIGINFDFDTGTDRTLVMTPSDITYAGTSLLGGALTTDQTNIIANQNKGPVVNTITADGAFTAEQIRISTGANISRPVNNIVTDTVTTTLGDLGETSGSLNGEMLYAKVEGASANWTIEPTVNIYENGVALSNKNINLTVGQSAIFENSTLGGWDIYGNYTLVSRFLPHPNAANSNPELIVNDPSSFTSEGTSIQSWNEGLGSDITAVANNDNGYGEIVARVTATSDGTFKRARLQPPRGDFINGEIYEVYLLHRQNNTTGSARYRISAGTSTAVDNIHSAHTDWVLHNFEFTYSGGTFGIDDYVRVTSTTGQWTEFKLSIKLKDD